MIGEVKNTRAVYAVYRGGDLICVGDINECHRATGLSRSRLYALVTHSKRPDWETRPRKQAIRHTVIRLEDDEDE